MPTLLLHPRLHVAGIALLAVLQRSPATLNFALRVQNALEPATRLLQRLALTTASLGAYHALSGATTAIYDTEPAAPLTLTVGEPLTFVFGVRNTMEAANSWSITGAVPPGLTVSGTLGAPLTSEGYFNNQFGQITGTPSEPGEFTLFLKPWNDDNATGETAEAFELNITVLPSSNTPTAPALHLSRTPEGFVVSWSAQAGQSYQLERASDLRAPEPWSPLALAIENNGQTRSALIPIDTVADALLLRLAASPSETP